MKLELYDVADHLDVTMQLLERSHQRSDIVCYLLKYEVVVCTECHYVLNKSPSIARHLVSAHLWSKTEATAIDQQFNDKAIRSPNHPNCPVLYAALSQHVGDHTIKL